MSSNYNNSPPPQSYGTPYSTYGASEQHEMQNLPQASLAAPTNVLGQQEFLSRIGQLRNEIRNISTNVQQISTLHQAALSGTDDTAQRRVDDLVAATQQTNNNIRDQLRALKTDVEATPRDSSGANFKKGQWEVLHRDFQKELRGYLEEEQSFRDRYQQQIARQYRIVNPDASDEEVRNAMTMDWANEGVFQSAISQNRTGKANTVLGNVRARHNELMEIEQSMNQLTTMIQDLDTIIIQQNEHVTQIERRTDAATGDLDGANKQLQIAEDKARHRRKLKWICTGIVVLILLAVALGVGLGVGLTQRAANVATGNTTRRNVDDVDIPLTTNLNSLFGRIALD